MSLYEALVASPGAAFGIMVALALLSISLGGYIEQRLNPRVPQIPKPPKLVPYVPEHLAYLAKTFGVDEKTPPLNSTHAKLVQLFADKDAEIASLKADLRSAKEDAANAQAELGSTPPPAPVFESVPGGTFYTVRHGGVEHSTTVALALKGTSPRAVVNVLLRWKAEVGQDVYIPMGGKPDDYSAFCPLGGATLIGTVTKVVRRHEKATKDPTSEFVIGGHSGSAALPSAVNPRAKTEDNYASGGSGGAGAAGAAAFYDVHLGEPIPSKTFLPGISPSSLTYSDLRSVSLVDTVTGKTLVSADLIGDYEARAFLPLFRRLDPSCTALARSLLAAIKDGWEGPGLWASSVSSAVYHSGPPLRDPLARNLRSPSGPLYGVYRLLPEQAPNTALVVTYRDGSKAEVSS